MAWVLQITIKYYQVINGKLKKKNSNASGSVYFPTVRTTHYNSLNHRAKNFWPHAVAFCESILFRHKEPGFDSRIMTLCHPIEYFYKHLAIPTCLGCLGWGRTLGGFSWWWKTIHNLLGLSTVVLIWKVLGEGFTEWRHVGWGFVEGRHNGWRGNLFITWCAKQIVQFGVESFQTLTFYKASKFWWTFHGFSASSTLRKHYLSPCWT